MKAKWVKSIIVEDPDGGDVEVTIYKHENGGMFGIDSSYLDQVAEDNEDEDCYVIPDPFGDILDPNTLDLFD